MMMTPEFYALTYKTRQIQVYGSRAAGSNRDWDPSKGAEAFDLGAFNLDAAKILRSLRQWRQLSQPTRSQLLAKVSPSSPFYPHANLTSRPHIDSYAD